MKSPRITGMIYMIGSVAGVFLLNWLVRILSDPPNQGSTMSSFYLLIPFLAGFLQVITGVHFTTLAADWDKLPMRTKKLAEIGVFLMFLLILFGWGVWLTINQ